jgi:hypothetical protein
MSEELWLTPAMTREAKWGSASKPGGTQSGIAAEAQAQDGTS